MQQFIVAHPVATTIIVLVLALLVVAGIVGGILYIMWQNAGSDDAVLAEMKEQGKVYDSYVPK